VIDFRYHLVSIVAVFLALAIGIVLGAAELQGPTYNLLNGTTAKLQNELNQANSQRDMAEEQANAGDAYAEAVEPVVLHNLLAGQKLLIVTEPGAQGSVVSGITSAANDAGAEVTGQINLQAKFFDTSDTTQDSLNQINLDVASHAGLTLDNTETYQQQAAQVIASQILTKSQGSATGIAGSGAGQDTNTATMLSAYAYAGFLTTSGQPAATATIAVVITPQTAPSDGSADSLDQLLIPVAQELAASSAATVVAGSSAGSGPGSPIAVLRSNNVANEVSTIDDADYVSGQSVVIEALAIQLNGGKPGSYGFASNGANAVAPSAAPTPTGSPSPSPTPTSSKKAKT
jgi:hypothetical protein